ncbi:MAG: dephospho-CoA kinase [Burkholderiales bacterium]
MALVIALTGGIGSGKSSVANMLGELGATVVDTDEIAHGLTAAGQPGALEIGAKFGPEYLTADGALDRTRMREHVFSNAPAKKKLEALLHPMIRAEVARRVSIAAGRAGGLQPPHYIVIVVPLLIETGAYRDLARRVLVVDCPEEEQVARVVRRSQLTPAAVHAIMATQVSRTERISHADDVVSNDGDLPALRAAVAALHRKYVDLAENSPSA